MFSIFFSIRRELVMGDGRGFCNAAAAFFVVIQTICHIICFSHRQSMVSKGMCVVVIMFRMQNADVDR